MGVASVINLLAGKLTLVIKKHFKLFEIKNIDEEGEFKVL